MLNNLIYKILEIIHGTNIKNYVHRKIYHYYY